jgi:hypothetical protein
MLVQNSTMPGLRALVDVAGEDAVETRNTRTCYALGKDQSNPGKGVGAAAILLDILYFLLLVPAKRYRLVCPKQHRSSVWQAPTEIERIYFDAQEINWC